MRYWICKLFHKRHWRTRREAQPYGAILYHECSKCKKVWVL